MDGELRKAYVVRKQLMAALSLYAISLISRSVDTLVLLVFCVNIFILILFQCQVTEKFRGAIDLQISRRHRLS